MGLPADRLPDDAVVLKEWAVAIEALLEGRQIMLLRKGGIVEETRDFQLISPSFYLMPTYEHQRKELLKPQYQAMLDQTLEGWSPQDTHVSIRAFGEVTETIEIVDQERLDRLRDLHIWTDAFAEERLKWKRTKPLHLLFIRVYRLSPPARVPLLPAYTGCRSWVKLETGIDRGTLTPVLEEEEYFSEVEKIKRALER
ncbi:DUF1802 family protein [Paenibacillus tarimensis]